MILVPVVCGGAQRGAGVMFVPVRLVGRRDPTVTDAGSLVRRAGVTWPSASRWRPHARTGAAHPEPASQASHVAPAGLQRTGSVEEIWCPGGLDEPAFDTEPGRGARAPPTLWVTTRALCGTGRRRRAPVGTERICQGFVSCRQAGEGATHEASGHMVTRPHVPPWGFMSPVE